MDLEDAHEEVRRLLPPGHSIVDAWRCVGACEDLHFIIEIDGGGVPPVPRAGARSARARRKGRRRR